MAEIPELQQPSGMDFITPTHQPFSVEAAGLTGENIHNAGNALMNFGVALGEADNQKKSAKRVLDIHKAGSLMDQAMVASEDDIRRNGASDGSDHQERLRVAADRAQNQISDLFKNSDDLTKEGVDTQIRSIRTKYEESTNINARQQLTADTITRVGDLSNQQAAKTFQHPEDFDQNVADYTNSMIAIKNTGLLDSKTIKANHRDGVAQIAHEAVAGLVDKTDFDGAKAAVDKYSPYFNQKELDDVRNMVRSAQTQHDDHLIKLQARTEKANELAVKKDQVKATIDLKGQMYAATAGADDPAAIAKVMDATELKFSRGEITNEQKNEVKGISKRNEDKVRDDAAVYSIKKLITDDSTTLDSIRKQIIKNTEDPATPEVRLKHSSASKLLEEVNKANNAQDKDPRYTSDRHIVQTALNAIYGPPDQQAREDAPIEKKLERANKDAEIMNEYYKNGNTNMLGAMSHVLGGGVRFQHPVQSVPGIPSDKQSNLKDLNEGFDHLRMNYKSMGWDDERFLKVIQQYKAKKAELIQNEGKKGLK